MKVVPLVAERGEEIFSEYIAPRETRGTCLETP